MTTEGGRMTVIPIQVWRFHDAPKELQDLSTHGGDEDWLALIPPNYKAKDIHWAESSTPFGCCDVSEHIVSFNSAWKGWKVLIGAHA